MWIEIKFKFALDSDDVRNSATLFGLCKREQINKLWNVFFILIRMNDKGVQGTLRRLAKNFDG